MERWAAGEVEFDGDCLVANQFAGAAQLVKHFRDNCGQILIIGRTPGNRYRWCGRLSGAQDSGSGGKSKQLTAGPNCRGKPKSGGFLSNIKQNRIENRKRAFKIEKGYLSQNTGERPRN